MTERRETTMAELTGLDLGHTIKIEGGPEGVLSRVLHEGGVEGGIQPTYVRLFTAGLTESTVGRFDPRNPVVVEPMRVDVIDAEPEFVDTPFIGAELPT